jgi:hypothetical protein
LKIEIEDCSSLHESIDFQMHLHDTGSDYIKVEDVSSHVDQ